MNRNKRINIRLTAAEHAAITKNAKASGMKVTEYVRFTLVHNTTSPALEQYRAVKAEIEKLKLEKLKGESK